MERLLLLLLVGVVARAEYKITLEEVSTVFLPKGGRVWGQDVVESASYDDKTKLLYVVGGRYRHAIDMKNSSSPKLLRTDTDSLTTTETTDISICGDYFIQTTDNKDDKSQGKIEIYKKFDVSRGAEVVYSKTVGEDADSVRFLPGCKQAVVTVHGSAYGKGDSFVDPKGKVIFIELPQAGYSGSFADNVKLTTLDFTKFDPMMNDILKTGARFVYRERNNKFSNDLEPGSIAVSRDGKKVYITLQVSNAIAVVDVMSKTITGLYGLGMKNWTNLEIDTSDKDGGILMRKWPIYSYYMPDGISYMKHGGKDYIVTANEGNDYDYSDLISWKEEIEGKDFGTGGRTIATSVSSVMKAALSDVKKLGVLRFTTENGEDNSAGYSKFVAYGGRSFSIWEAATMKQVYDSGDDLEKRHASMFPYLFNGEVDGSDTPKQDADERSPKRGPEPESIAIGSLGRLGVIFVGIEAPGTVGVYSVLDDIKMPRFEFLWQSVKDTSVPWKTLFDNKDIKGIDPEDLIFLDDKRSPTGKPALIVVGTKSASVTLLHVKLTGTVPSASKANGLKISVLLVAFVLALQSLLSTFQE